MLTSVKGFDYLDKIWNVNDLSQCCLAVIPLCIAEMSKPNWEVGVIRCVETELGTNVYFN